MTPNIGSRDSFDRYSGGASRRAFAGGLAGIGAAALLPGVLAAQTPKRGGHLRVAVSDAGNTETIDPATQLLWVDLARCQQLYERLVDFVPGQGIVPGLATGWEPNATATEWVFTLRGGIEFHNGKTMTATDVAYSFNRLRDPSVGSGAAGYMADVTEIRAEGDDRIVVVLSQPNADIPYLFSEYHFLVTPDGSKNFPTDAIGTGPWKVKEYQPGINSIFERNPNYWRDGQPYVDSIETFGIPDDVARVNALLSGEIDLLQKLDPNAIQQVTDNSGLALLEIPGAAHVTFPMRADTAPFDNPDVRIALKHAFDRQRYIDIAFGGHGVPGRDHPIPPFDPFHCDAIPVPQADPDKVKFHLKKAGHESTVFELQTSDATFGGVNSSVALAELMRENGVSVEVKRVPADDYWSNTWMKAPWCASNWGGNPTAGMMLSVGYASDAAWNESYWRNERFDSLLKEARGTTDTARRTELFCELEGMLASDGSSIIPAFTNWIDAHQSKVKGLKAHPYMFLGSMYWGEVWIDA